MGKISINETAHNLLIFCILNLIDQQQSKYNDMSIIFKISTGATHLVKR